jgi:pimeloyl-ACP methyl ester carboxylesterase
MRPCSIGQPARCGTLWVPVDRLTGRGPKIPIRVVVVPAAGTPRHADPIVYFDGGPGSSAVDDAEQEIPELSLDTTRDDVFIDQRGTGASNLTCPELPGLVPPAMLRSKVAACVARARGELAFYSTAMAADDVAEVLTDLGYQRADLVGASYGVTSAQVFLIRHPQMVRTMTLLSGSLLSVPMFEREPQNAQQSLDNVFAECEAEPACHRAFPHLAADWQALWSSISAAPWVVPASLEANHKVGSVDADWVASEIHQLLMDATTQVDLPLAIHLLGTSTDRAATIVAISKAMPPSSSAGESSAQQLMALVIRCDEAWAADDPAHLIGATSFEYGTDVEAARWWQEVCSAVPAAGAAGGSEVLHPSAVPVLALNGEEDPQDPPANMAGARSLWPDSLELAVPDQGHDVDANLSGGCVFRLLSSFIASGRAVGLDTSCLKTVPQPPFTLSLSALAGSQ